MAKAVVVVATVHFVLVLTLYQAIKDNDRDYNSNRPARRLGYNNSPPHFDPLLESMERSLDKDTNESLQNNSTYLNDDGRINITYRIMVLFPFLDVAPKDGFIDYNEMEFWMVHQAIDRLNYRTKMALELHDKNGDGLVSFSEYLPHITNKDIEGENKRCGPAGWWYDQFKIVDADHNGLLNFEELKDFLHPEESTIEKIQEWLVKDEIRQLDYDNDHKLDWMEFEMGAYDAYMNYIALETKGDEINVPSEEDVFAMLDRDQDDLLDWEELIPFLQYLNPGEVQRAKYYTRSLIDEADEDGDGKLTVHEMINNEQVFYNAFYLHTKESDEKIRDEL